MAYEHCTVAKDGHVLTITINRPDRMNALHPPANAELAQAFDDFAADPDLWVAILTGAGDRAFSAGNDLRYQAEGNAVTVPPSPSAPRCASCPSTGRPCSTSRTRCRT